MAKREKVDTGTGEITEDLDPEAKEQGGKPRQLEMPDEPLWDTPEEAAKAIARESKKLDRLERETSAAQATLKEAKAAEEEQTTKVMDMVRALQNPRLFKDAARAGALLLVALFAGLFLHGCGEASAQPQIPVETWDDLDTLPRRFELHHVDDGIGIVVDTNTGQGWMVVGCTDCGGAGAPVWNAVSFLGNL